MRQPGKRQAKGDLRSDISAELQRISGLPCPPCGIENEREMWAAHEVASGILLELRFNDDPEAAKLAALQYTMQNPVHPIGELIPHIERALGRKLLQGEIAAGTIYE